MRIISGNHKGKRLLAPKKLQVRPTMDMHKEALFNILINRYTLSECKVIDLFSGTGNIAYEFASRGTNKIIAVDSNYACIQYITKTSLSLNFPIHSIKSDVFYFLKKTKEQFDIIFADPPYKMAQAEYEKLLNIIFERNLLSNNGIIVIEHASQTDLSHLKNFKEHRKYGSSQFSFFF